MFFTRLKHFIIINFNFQYTYFLIVTIEYKITCIACCSFPMSAPKTVNSTIGRESTIDVLQNWLPGLLAAQRGLEVSL